MNVEKEGLRCPKSLFDGTHEGWREKVVGEDVGPPVKGRWRGLFPEYDVDA